MKKKPAGLLIVLLVFALLAIAARPLVCWKIGLDLKWHRAYCWSTEFDAKQRIIPEETEIPFTPEPSSTPEIPLPYATPTATATVVEPYPAPTSTLPAYPWGGFEP